MNKNCQPFKTSDRRAPEIIVYDDPAKRKKVIYLSQQRWTCTKRPQVAVEGDSAVLPSFPVSTLSIPYSHLEMRVADNLFQSIHLSISINERHTMDLASYFLSIIIASDRRSDSK